MLVIAKQEITITFIKDIVSVTRYYILQSSEPSAPTTNPPPAGWSDIEPTYTSGSNNTLYFVDLTVFTDGTWTYSNVSKSSSYEAAKDAFDKIDINNNVINDRLSSIETNTESINLYVLNLETNFDATTDKLQDDIYNLQEKVDLQITEDTVNIQIDKKLQNGVNKVETETGFKFDESGLNITKSNSQTSTLITENGMTINDTNGDTLLAANKAGVTAKNLHATTYLIIGTNIRFENYERNGVKRAGCFWVEVD